MNIDAMMPSIDEQIAELKAAGWIPKTSTIWISPDGQWWLGPHGAWKRMRAAASAAALLKARLTDYQSK